MNLETLLPGYCDNSLCRFHLAKQDPTGTRPIDALARSREEWATWQHYRGKKKERFTKDCIVSFAQISSNQFLFGGVFDIISRAGESYEVSYRDDASELIGRLIIDYHGNSQRATVFRPTYIYENSQIRSLLEFAYQGEPFYSYDEINHDFTQIEIVVKNKLNDWKVALSSVYGIYLLTDKLTGRSYVGSAYGEQGIWGRWNDYIFGYHGNNKGLKELYEIEDSSYFKKNFKFTLLELMSKTKTPEEVIQRETLWKRKLLTIDHGYNEN